MKPLVSVIVPVYNVERYVERCLNSIRGQTYRNLEIIIVNDGSPDRSHEICRAFAEQDRRIVYIEQENHGLGLARDAGIDVARGEWLCFVDSDDWVAPDYVELMLETAVDNDCLLVQCHYKRVLEYTQPKSSEQTNVKLFDWREFWMYAWSMRSFGLSPTAAWGRLYHSSIFSNVRFGDFRYSEDNLFSVRAIDAAMNKNFAIVEKALYYYFYREDGLCHAKTDLRILGDYRAKTEMMNYLSEMDKSTCFFAAYVFCQSLLIEDYMKLSCDLPNESEKYTILRDYILSQKDEILRICPDIISVLAGSWRVWDNIKNNGMILYGFGMKGRGKLFPWLKRFGIRVFDIWDKKYNGTVIDGVPIRFIHDGFERSIPVAIAIADKYQRSLASIKLSDAGYLNQIASEQIEDAIRWKKLSTYLPELLVD